MNLWFLKFVNDVEKPVETLRLHQLTSHLVRAPNSISGGHEFKSHVRQELGALTKSGKAFGVRSFYSGDPDAMSEHDHVRLSGCVTLTAWHVTDRLTCLADSLA